MPPMLTYMCHHQQPAAEAAGSRLRLYIHKNVVYREVLHLNIHIWWFLLFFFGLLVWSLAALYWFSVLLYVWAYCVRRCVCSHVLISSEWWIYMRSEWAGKMGAELSTPVSHYILYHSSHSLLFLRAVLTLKLFVYILWWWDDGWWLLVLSGNQHLAQNWNMYIMCLSVCLLRLDGKQNIDVPPCTNTQREWARAKRRNTTRRPLRKHPQTQPLTVN